MQRGFLPFCTILSTDEVALAEIRSRDTPRRDRCHRSVFYGGVCNLLACSKSAAYLAEGDTRARSARRDEI